jgi:neutral ceramidase
MILRALFSAALLWPATATELRVGIGAVDITGDDAEVLDRLHVKAIVFRQGPERFAIVECDQTAVSADVTMPTRQLVAEKTGIPLAHVSVAATHTHMATPHTDLVEAIVRAVTEADATARPVKLFAGAATEYRISFNRRYFMKDGHVAFNPMFLNPDIVRPAGPIDPEVGLLLFRDAADDRPLASLTNFALHLDTVKEYGAVYSKAGTGSRNSVSADYPYWLEEALRRTFGRGFQSLFATGTCGNINHWDFSKPGPQSGHKKMARHLGESLAESVLTAVPKLKEQRPSLAARSRVVRIPLRPYSEEELAWAKKIKDTPLSSRSEEMEERQSFLDRVRSSRILAIEAIRRSSADLPLDVQVFRLSDDTAIVTLPGEMFVEHGLAIKNMSPFENTLVIELANNTCGYVPNRKAYAQGEYEVETAMLPAGGGEMLVQTALDMLRELKRDVR